jgi:hypothetical protein
MFDEVIEVKNVFFRGINKAIPSKMPNDSSLRGEKLKSSKDNQL